MKTIKMMITLVMALSLTTVVGQTKVKQVEKTKTTKTFNLKKDGISTPYKVTVYKTSTTPIKFVPSDAGQKEQNTMTVPANVTKLMFIDSDVNNEYDKYVVVRYLKDENDSFKLLPTERGFKVVVDNRYVEYVMGEGVYFINNEDRDFFYVESFDVI